MVFIRRNVVSIRDEIRFFCRIRRLFLCGANRVFALSIQELDVNFVALRQAHPLLDDQPDLPQFRDDLAHGRLGSLQDVTDGLARHFDVNPHRVSPVVLNREPVAVAHHRVEEFGVVRKPLVFVFRE